jgi:hypothetical protein
LENYRVKPIKIVNVTDIWIGPINSHWNPTNRVLFGGGAEILLMTHTNDTKQVNNACVSHNWVQERMVAAITFPVSLLDNHFLL